MFLSPGFEAARNYLPALLVHARASGCRTDPGLHAALLFGHRSNADAQPKRRLAFVPADCWGVEAADSDESTSEMRRCPVEPATLTCLEHNEHAGTRHLVLFAWKVYDMNEHAVSLEISHSSSSGMRSSSASPLDLTPGRSSDGPGLGQRRSGPTAEPRILFCTLALQASTLLLDGNVRLHPQRLRSR